MDPIRLKHAAEFIAFKKAKPIPALIGILIGLLETLIGLFLPVPANLQFVPFLVLAIGLTLTISSLIMLFASIPKTFLIQGISFVLTGMLMFSSAIMRIYLRTSEETIGSSGEGGLFFWGLVVLMFGSRCFDIYKRFSSIDTSLPTKEDLTQTGTILSDILQSGLTRNGIEIDFLTKDYISKNQWKGILREDHAILLRKDMKNVFVENRANIEISEIGETKAGKIAQLNIADKGLKIIVSSLHYKTLAGWSGNTSPTQQG